ncbi:hypothetical protein B0H15DRAFT_168692 [Mycena belliarum]|uniref:Uncharacterized protein n=1 Tax=Mycena belliarum TaxID=1033014 RepID=A0AAD6UBE5_9AGAR|nr:hypothetical protein B0H15DRAFT_168692 [Mycena belliae]
MPASRSAIRQIFAAAVEPPRAPPSFPIFLSSSFHVVPPPPRALDASMPPALLLLARLLCCGGRRRPAADSTVRTIPNEAARLLPPPSSLPATDRVPASPAPPPHVDARLRAIVRAAEGKMVSVTARAPFAFVALPPPPPALRPHDAEEDEPRVPVPVPAPSGTGLHAYAANQGQSESERHSRLSSPVPSPSPAGSCRSMSTIPRASAAVPHAKAGANPDDVPTRRGTHACMRHDPRRTDVPSPTTHYRTLVATTSLLPALRIVSYSLNHLPTSLPHTFTACSTLDSSYCHRYRYRSCHAPHAPSPDTDPLSPPLSSPLS